MEDKIELTRKELEKLLKNVCKSQKTTLYVNFSFKDVVKNFITGRAEFPIQDQILNCPDTSIELHLNFLYHFRNLKQRREKQQQCFNKD